MTVLAADLGENAGPLGLLVVILLGIATVLLVRSMNRHVTRLPPEFPAPPARGLNQDDPPADT